MKKKATTAIYLETKRPLKDGTHAVKLRVTHNRKRKYYGTGHHFTEKDFEKVMGAKPRNGFKEAAIELNGIEAKAIRVIDSISKHSPFSFEKFEDEFFGISEETDSLFGAFDAHINDLSREGRAASLNSFQCAKQSLQTFLKLKRPTFADITPAVLSQYEKDMLANGKSITTVGIYLRSLRILFNKAIKKGKVDANHYPFGKYKYVIPAGRNIKKALTIEEVGKIYHYETIPGSNEEKARDLWIFSYLCNGINLKDIARLKYKNLDGDRLVFIRAKTERSTKKNQSPIVVDLKPRAKAIIEKWRSENRDPESYIFSILSPGIDAERERALVAQMNKVINKYVRRIGKKLEIDTSLTFYVARHSFSTILYHKGAPIALISELLGHKSVATTVNYLKSFGIEFQKEWTDQLTDF